MIILRQSYEQVVIENAFLFHVHNHCKGSTFKSKALQSISYCSFGEVLLVSMRIHRDTQQTKDWFSKDSNKDAREENKFFRHYPLMSQDLI